MGFWVGLFVAHFTLTDPTIMDIFFSGCISSGFSYFVITQVGDWGFTFNNNPRPEETT
jgi:hypothetical protein